MIIGNFQSYFSRLCFFACSLIFLYGKKSLELRIIVINQIHSKTTHSRQWKLPAFHNKVHKISHIPHGATKIHGSLAFQGLRAKVKIQPQIWKHAFPSQRKIIDNIGYIANMQTQIHTNTHPIYEIL